MNLGKTLALASVLALSACPSNNVTPPNSDAGTCDPSDPACSAACQTDMDCGDIQTFACINYACTPVCTTKANCMAHPAYDNGAWPGCETGSCICDARKCVGSFCAGDSECGTNQACKNGACVAAEIDPDSCEITPSVVVLRKDQQVTFTATAYKGTTVSLVGANPFVWSALDASVVKVDDNGTFKGAAASGAFKEKAIKAEVRVKPSAVCHAKVLVLDAISNGARVVVTDEYTGRLVSDVTVVINGVNMVEDATFKGVFTATNFTAPATVSVFHKDYQYVTVVGLTKTDLMIPIRRNADETKGGGFKGKFTNFPDSEISFGLAGTSIPGNYTDMDLSVLVGRLVDTDITFAQKTFTAPLPSGSMLGIGTKRYKDQYQAWGTAGTCIDETMTIKGECGTRSGFGLMGTIPVTAVTPVFNDFSSGAPINVGKMFALAMPYLRTFKSSVVRDISYKIKTVPADYTQLYKDPEAFPTADFTPTIALGLKHTVNVPALPEGFDAVAVLAGSNVPGRGMIPLGLTAGTDTNDECGAACKKDGKVVGIDVLSDNPIKLAYHDDAKLTLRMAPNHSGTEGSRYGVFALAFPTTGTMPNGAAVSSAVALNKTAMPNGTEVTFPASLPALVDATYDFRAGKATGAKLLTEAGVHKAVFTSDKNRKWIVYYNKADFDVPKPPTGFEDRTMFDMADRATSTSKRATVSWWAIKAVDGTKTIGVDDYFDAAYGRAANLSDYLQSFSTNVIEPTLTFVAPTDTECGTNVDAPLACTVPDGSYTFKVKVTALEVPTKAKIYFEANTGEKLLVSAMDAEWTVSAKFKTPLMKDENMANLHVITATMVKPESTETNIVPIDPKVSEKLTVIVAN